MIVTRRTLLGLGGGFAAGLLLRPAFGAGRTAEIAMVGNSDGSRVGFDPVGLHVAPGARVRWVNRDAGNSHTATAYHPDLLDRPRRIPDGAEPWDSDYLLPDEVFAVTLTVPGVYDFYCVPHEHAGMVGRIVVGEPPRGWQDYAGGGDTEGALPHAALDRFPSVEAIMQSGIVREG
ncbi:hypothetical protein FQ775_00110 [Nitratireductor mangrovi]|uniref:Blue (type 1) copper domain-containing protein n=2 Tax=Nitratireductor mangrovi TaxID=2599600 RepID=A0A5B8KTH6_9HYPH|nr:hypothetical protein FQ775_00110 [Nitratireductor mangrovi]